ncbi:MAG: hypothetical protein IKZ35_03075 [Clostridia bacterium]|nr:hypothetical protein [Clostridia bacterium]
MKKNIIRISIAVVWLVTVVLSFYVGMAYHWASTTKIEMSKDYNEIVVEENEIADYTVFIDIPEKYGALKQIEEPIRKTISLYMQANNLKLSVGTHRFDRIDGTLEEYLNEEFRFETIR